MTDSLPTEIWWKILRLVPGPSLCQVSLVCHFFHQLIQDPNLWSHVQIRRDVIEKEGLDKLLTNPRLCRVNEIDLSYLDLTQESTENLMLMIKRFRRILLRYCQMSLSQLSTIVETMRSLDYLEMLSLDSICLSDINAEALCQSMIIVNELDLNNTGMTLTQLKSLMINIPSHRSHIKELTLSGLDLSELSSHHLILPLNQVVRFDVSNSRLTEEQLSSLLCSCIWSETIEDLDVSGSDLTNVSSQLILDSVACLTCLNISATVINRKQLISVLNAVTSDWSTLISLNLSTLDLTNIPSSLLSNSVSYLTNLKLNYCKLTQEQVTSVVRAVAKSGVVETLELTRQNLSDVPKADMTKVVMTVTKLSCNYCNMTSEMLLAILTAAGRYQSRLRSLGIIRTDLTQIPENILKKAKKKLETLNLNYCKLTKNQKLL